MANDLEQHHINMCSMLMWWKQKNAHDKYLMVLPKMFSFSHMAFKDTFSQNVFVFVRFLQALILKVDRNTACFGLRI